MGPKRRVGLSRFAKPDQLHSVIHGKQREKLSQTVDINAEPLSSADEDDEGDDKPQVSRPALEDSDSDLSGPERKARLDIKPTVFGKKQDGSSFKTLLRGPGRLGGKDNSANNEDGGGRGKRRRTNDDRTSIQSPSSSFPSSAEHLKNEHGFVKLSRPKSTYGSKGNLPASQESQQRVKTSKVKDLGVSSSESEEKPRKAKFKVIGEELSPVKPATKNRLTVKDDITSSPVESSKGKLIAAREDSFSPTKSPKKILIKPPVDDSEESQSSQSKISISTGITSASRTKPKHRGNLWGKGQDRIAKQKNKRKRSPPRAKFKMPVDFGDCSQESRVSTTNTDLSLSDLSELSDLDVLEGLTKPASVSSDREASLAENMTKCPWCGETVSEKTLNDFSKGSRLNVRMQTRFCQKHKKETALNTWREKGYPTVHWDELEDRFDKHRKSLLDVVNGKQSYYRDSLAEKIETGQGRSLKKEGNLNPGYYGPRGCKLMCDYLVEEFGELLKEKAVSDRIIAGRGSAAFIQSVLVLELGTMLIKEDMKVSTPEARDIMEDSKALGEMIHEEE